MEEDMEERRPARQPSKRVQKLKKKILLLRIEEVILLVVIAVLLLNRCQSSMGASSAFAHFSDEQTETEYAWLQEHSGDFPEGKIDAAAGNPGLIHFLYNYGNGTYDHDAVATLTSNEKSQDIPLFMQWDERWGYDLYGDNNIGMCGCAPTCLAMVTEGMTKNADITPSSVANYAMSNDYYLFGTGTKWGLFEDYAAMNGLMCTELGADTASIYSELEQGHPVICSMSPGTFTTGGHFIVMCGLKNGEVVINDPNNVELSAKTWNLDGISSEIKNAWAFAPENM